MNALLLGAGASYELGLPLVWELTNELKTWLTPEKLDWLNDEWKRQGGGRPAEVINLAKELISVESMHYENLIGALEVETNRERNTERYQELHGFRNWLLEMIYWILYERQVKNEIYIKSAVKDLYGITKLAEESKPLWIFSLNHDLNLEIVAAEHNIPIKSGFTTQVSLPTRDEFGNIGGDIAFEYLSREDIDNNNYDFFGHGEYGINLIKLHGALDIFAQGDEVNYLKIKPKTLSCEGYLSELRVANEELRYYPFVKCTNEIAYADSDGVMQFLRRSLLSGAHKFTGKVSQIAPSEFLILFKAHINYADEIACIGYSFGDPHINEVITRLVVI